jgi:2-phospho-L-lactate guanylyltransferase
MMKDMWVVLPVRGMSRGKTRLAPALDESARVRLNRWLFLRTLDVIRQWRGDLARCVVVSRCPEVYAIARERGAPLVCEIDARSDQNRSASAGAEYALDRGARKLVLLPSDLPEMSADALNDLVVEAARERHLILAPDAAGTGTNAVVLDAHAHRGLCFGERSFPRYLAWAEASGWSVTVCTRPELTFDLDTPEDWAAWSARNPRDCEAVIY